MKTKLTLGSAVVIVLLVVLYLILPAPETAPAVSLESIPAFSGEPYIILNNNVPKFTEKEYTTQSYERYEDLDALNRCTLTMACIGSDLMPTEDRGEFGKV